MIDEIESVDTIAADMYEVDRTMVDATCDFCPVAWHKASHETREYWRNEAVCHHRAYA
jgi:hypothetical protein